MDRQTYLDSVSEALKRRGASADEIKKFNEKLNGFTVNDLDKLISDGVSPEEFVNASLGSPRSRIEASDIDLDALFGISDSEASPVFEDNSQAAFVDDIEFPDYSPNEDEIPGNIEYPGDTVIVDSLKTEPENVVRVGADQSKDKRRGKPVAPANIKSKAKTKTKGTPLFWGLFVLTLPITIPLFAAVCAIAMALYITVTAVIVALVAVTIGVVAAGTAFSLVGIMYGITQLTKQLPVGLYEMGVGIALGGVTLLVSILLYNLSVRFAPLLYKCINKLARVVFRALGDLFEKCKRECAK